MSTALTRIYLLVSLLEVQALWIASRGLALQKLTMTKMSVCSKQVLSLKTTAFAQDEQTSLEYVSGRESQPVTEGNAPTLEKRIQTNLS